MDVNRNQGALCAEVKRKSNLSPSLGPSRAEPIKALPGLNAQTLYCTLPVHLLVNAGRVK